MLAVLVVQGPETQFRLAVCRFFHIEYRNAVRIFSGIFMLFDQVLDRVPAIDGGMRIELAADDDVFAVGADIDAVRRFRFRDQKQRIVLDGDIDRNDSHPVDHFDVIVVFGEFGQFFPVVDVQVVRIVTAHTGFVRRHTFFDTPRIHFGVERVGESPAVAGFFTGVAEILHVRRHFDRERLLGKDASLVVIEFPDGDPAAVGFLVLFDGVVVVVVRCAVLARFKDVFAVGGEECPAVVGFEDRVDDDLFCYEVTEVDDGDTRIGLVVDGEPFPVVDTVGFGDRGVVGVSPGDLFAADVSFGQNLFGVVVISPSLPRFGGENTDVFQNTHRWDTVHHHLSGLSAGTEDDVLVTSAAWGVGLGRGQQVLLTQSAFFHHFVQFRIRGCKTCTDQRTDCCYR